MKNENGAQCQDNRWAGALAVGDRLRFLQHGRPRGARWTVLEKLRGPAVLVGRADKRGNIIERREVGTMLLVKALRGERT